MFSRKSTTIKDGQFIWRSRQSKQWTGLPRDRQWRWPGKLSILAGPHCWTLPVHRFNLWVLSSSLMKPILPSASREYPKGRHRYDYENPDGSKTSLHSVRPRKSQWWFFFLMFNNIFILSEQEADKFSTSSASTPPLHPSSSLCLSVWDRLQDLNWISHCAHSHSVGEFTHSPLCSLTHTCGHPPVPELTHPHLDSPTHTWAHTQAHPLTPRLIHSHPYSPIHTHAHPLTPGLICSHLGSFLQQGHWTAHKTWNTSQGSSMYDVRTSNNSESCLRGL